jgi:hypothetical protein
MAKSYDTGRRQRRFRAILKLSFRFLQEQHP